MMSPANLLSSHKNLLALLLTVFCLPGCWALESPPEEKDGENKQTETDTGTKTDNSPKQPGSTVPVIKTNDFVSTPYLMESFQGDSWVTAVPRAMGSPKAVKGGILVSDIPNWPENLRVYGTGANTFLNSIVESLCYQTLLDIDPNTLTFIPSLASHWKVSDDSMQFTFRINPNAKWSDGKPVIPEDIIATYNLIMDETLVDPMSRITFDKFHTPEKISDQVVQVRVKEGNRDWRNFITFSGMRVLPAHEIGKITGKEYLDQYNFKYTAVSGPYAVSQEDIKDNESITITRRDDFWGNEEPYNQGLYNFDKIRFLVIRDRRLGFDKAVKGELEFKVVYTAKWWVEDLENVEAIEKGWLLPQKVFTKYPQGFQGMAFNTRKAPLDDLKVRKALAHLYDRSTMLEKFAYNEYTRLKSYFPSSDSENPDNKVVDYDPQLAVSLLKEAGWDKTGEDGIRLKDGKKLSLTIQYRSQAFEKYLTSFKQSCEKAGVEINLTLVNPETHWKNVQERKFEISGMSWGAILFPSPRSNYHSKLADEEGSNNITGFKNTEADKIIEEYDAEFDPKKRVELLKRLDAIIFNEHPYSLEWYLPCERLLYWNKFGMPETVLPKYSDWRAAFTYWWVDPSKEETLKKARKGGEQIKNLPATELKPWDNPEGKVTAAGNGSSKVAKN